MLRATGLGKSYRAPSGARVPVLASVDLTVKGGEFVVISGPSGSGKTTLLNVLGLLEDAEHGEVWYERTARFSCTAPGYVAAVWIRTDESGRATPPSWNL